MWSLTLERKEDLLRKKKEKQQELEKLKATSKEDLWREDLKEFLKKLDEVEQKQLEDQQIPTKKGAKKKDGAKKKVALAPSPSKGIRVVPKISDELKRKASAAVAAKDKKAAKNAFGKSLNAKMAEFDEPDEFDDMADDKEHNRSLSDRLGFSLKAEEKPKKVKVKKESSGTVKGTKHGKKKGENPWDDGSASNSDYSSDGFSASGSDPGAQKEKYTPPPKDRTGRKRKTVNYKFADHSDSDHSLHANSETEASKNGHSGKSTNAIPTDDSEDDSDIQDMRKNIKVPTKQAKIDTLFSNQANTKKEPKEPECDNAFDSLLENGCSNSVGTAKTNQNGNTGAMKNGGNPYESDSDESPLKHKNAGRVTVPKISLPSKKSQFQFSDSDSSQGDGVGHSSSGDEFVPTKKVAPKKKLPAEKKKLGSKLIDTQVNIC